MTESDEMIELSLKSVKRKCYADFLLVISELLENR